MRRFTTASDAKAGFIAMAMLVVFCAPPLFADCNSAWFTLKQTRTDTAYGFDHLRAIDFDHDGILDLIGVLDLSNVSSTNKLAAWRGRGDGTFDVPIDLGTRDVDDILAVDVNHDGRLDLVMTQGAGELAVRLGNATGFDGDIRGDIRFDLSRIAAIDFDNDGTIDLAATSYAGDVVELFRGEGNGHFKLARSIPAEDGPWELAVADFDGDGRIDVAYGRIGLPTLSVIFQNADGSFTAPLVMQSAGTPIIFNNWVSRLIAADVNEDGRPDLVASNYEMEPSGASVAVFLNRGGRAFSRTLLAQPMGNGADYGDLHVADFNGDGHLDVAASSVNGGTLMAFIGRGDGTFRAPAFFDEDAHFFSFAVADFNRDGIADIAAGSYGKLLMATGACTTQLTLYTDSPTITIGDAVPLRAVVSGTPPDGKPHGAVTFYRSQERLGAAAVDDRGIAAFDALLPMGTNAVRAEYSEGPASTAPIVVEVTSQKTTTSLTIPPQPHVYGSPLRFTITVRNPYDADEAAWVNVDVDGERVLRYAGREAQLRLGVGRHVITAIYDGYGFDPRSMSAPQVIDIARATPLIRTAPALFEGQALQVSVSGPAGWDGPTGSVQVSEGTRVIGTAAVVNGIATVPLDLVRGGHDLTVNYSGDANFDATITFLSLQVTPQRRRSF